MKIFFNKIIDILFLKGCLFAFFKWKIFSLSSFKIVNSAKLSGVNPQIVIDVGANIGQFSEACYQIFNKVRIIAIEPDFKTAKDLKDLHLKAPLSAIDQDEAVKKISSLVGYLQIRLSNNHKISNNDYQESKLRKVICYFKILAALNQLNKDLYFYYIE